MVKWARAETGGEERVGRLEGETFYICDGDLFNDPAETGDTVALADISLLTPCTPTKIVALWNNSKANAEKQELDRPDHPLHFLKGPNTYLPSGDVIQKPASYDGRVIYEAELGIVIGKRATNVPAGEAAAHIFGYTCVNDVTALQLLDADPSFPQWARAKGFDTFGAFGPVIETELDLSAATIKAELNGRERQNYAVSDLFYGPDELVSLISHDMTLEAGDIISCGTGPGALPMKPGAQIDVIIEGIGTLSNSYEDPAA